MIDSVAFDRAAGYYDATRGFPPGEEAAAAALFVAAGNLTAQSHALEVGIGTGRIALPLALCVGRLTGVDLSRPMLDRLRAKRRTEPVSVVRGDITRLPVASCAFDAVIAVHIFHLVPGWQRALQEVARALRPGGRLLSGWNDRTVRAGGAGAAASDLIWAAWTDAIAQDEPPNVGVPRAQYATFAVDAGWVPAGAPQRHTFTGQRTVRDLVTRLDQRVWSSSWRLPDDVHARGMAAIRDVIAAHQIDLDAVVTLDMTFNVAAYLPPTA